MTSATSPNRTARALFEGIAGDYDRLGWVLSFGQDRRWRRAVVDEVRRAPARRALDVATGPGGIARAVRRATGAFVVGVDLTWEMLEVGRRRLADEGDTRVALVQARAEQLPFRDGAFDAVTFSYLLRYVQDPQATLDELARPLVGGGTMASLEFHVPGATGWHGLWWCYTRAVLPLAGRLLGGRGWQRVGHFLGPSISGHYRHYPVDWTLEAWQRAGMSRTGARVMSLGGGLVMWGVRTAPTAAGAP